MTDPLVWTREKRQLLWDLYVLAEPGTGIWGRISAKVGHTVKACQTEIWKTHRCRNEGLGWHYWEHPDRLEIKLSFERVGQPWSQQERNILRDAHHSKLPAQRIAELLGRDVTEVLHQIEQITARGRKGFFPRRV